MIIHIPLIITDIKLPGKTGIDLLEYVKSKEPDVPVIMITAFGYDCKCNKCHEEGGI